MNLQSFGVPKGNTTDACVLKFSDGRTVRISKAEQDADGTAAKIRTRVRNRLESHEKSQFHVHKNRDGSFTYAAGIEPKVWPEDSL
jgi:hypothetical protein